MSEIVLIKTKNGAHTHTHTHMYAYLSGEKLVLFCSAVSLFGDMSVTPPPATPPSCLLISFVSFISIANC